MKTFKLTINEDELKALISHHAYKMFGNDNKTELTIETSSRIHDLTKRLNKKDNEPADEVEAGSTAQNTTTSGW